MGYARKTHKKFKRLPPDERPGVRLQPADLEIMLQIYRHRFIEADTLYKLFPDRSNQMISRRLHKLYHNEYIDRPLAQRGGNDVRAGSKHLGYAIDNLGAHEVQTQLELDISANRWRQKNAELTPLGADHFLDITKFVARLAAATFHREGVALRYADEIIPPEVAQKRPPGLFNTLRADVSWHVQGQQEGTAPDAIIALEVGKKRQVLFVEIDRGTETIEPNERQLRSPRFWHKTSILRKLLIYNAAFRSRAHERQLGLNIFRVLTITTQPERVERMQQCFKNHLSAGDNKANPGLFVFGDWKTLSEQSDFLSAPYVNAVGRPVNLLPTAKRE